jgi:rSAM/selenodomain-associated transferase 1
LSRAGSQVEQGVPAREAEYNAAMGKRAALIVFARAPVAGHTKTRLIPALGAARAAQLYRCFVLDTLEAARRAPADVIVAGADPQHLDCLRALADEACPEAAVIGQRGADLGERIANAVRDALGLGPPRAVVIGSDSPDLPPERVREALDLAAERDLVLGPCSDGGYYLIGMQAVMPQVFRGIEWSSETVLADTIRRAQEIEASIALLEPWQDVDTPEDLRALRARLAAQSLAGQPIGCNRTWGYLSGLPEEAGL